MKLIVISKENFFPEEACWINAMMSEYPFILHLRKPFASLAEFETLVQQIHPVYYDRIVLHDHYALAESLFLKFTFTLLVIFLILPFLIIFLIL